MKLWSTISRAAKKAVRIGPIYFRDWPLAQPLVDDPDTITIEQAFVTITTNQRTPSSCILWGYSTMTLLLRAVLRFFFFANYGISSMVIVLREYKQRTTTSQSLLYTHKLRTGQDLHVRSELD